MEDSSYLELKTKIEEAKKKLKLRENRENAEREDKLQATPVQKLLPDIFEGKRVVPNCFLRSALFGMVRKGRRRLVENEPIFTMSQYEVIFSGAQLDQNDLELWDTLIYLAKEQKVNDCLRITLHELCKRMNLTKNQERYQVLIARAERLKFGTVKIKTGKKSFSGSLINNVYIDEVGDGKLVIEYNKHLMPLFADNDYTFINMEVKRLLGDHQLARWLYNFYESHSQPMTFTLQFLQNLCRSETEQKEFKRQLKNAMELIKNAYIKVNLNSKWDYIIDKNNSLTIFPNGKYMKTLKSIGFKSLLKKY